MIHFVNNFLSQKKEKEYFGYEILELKCKSLKIPFINNMVT